MTESESVALPLGDTPISILISFNRLCLSASLHPAKFVGWVVGFEPTYTGATTLGLNHLTIPTMSMLVNFVHCVVAVSLVMRVQFLKELATWNGLEPSTSSVTGWHSNQLNYQAANGGSYRARTCDPLLVRQMLSQLS